MKSASLTSFVSLPLLLIRYFSSSSSPSSLPTLHLLVPLKFNGGTSCCDGGAGRERGACGASQSCLGCCLRLRLSLSPPLLRSDSPEDHSSYFGLFSSSPSSGRNSSSIRESFSAVSGLATADVVEIPIPFVVAEVSIKHLASLNKPKIPILVMRCLFAIASGPIFPVFSIIFTSAIEMFYRPPDILRRDSRFWSLMFVVIGLAALIS
ncbi:ABC transporter B family member 5-like isoform X2 [Spinacia oleracea]|uniref:ABC transporter B family member 5-like isoform X2 n=1 Tax=Spinacia oleracea TaxID=3562 RepID=A0A9R0J0G4_SPIOL|nr:ABC transporter B family member 5-like isoform X2 [Spinacia oleracea]